MLRSSWVSYSNDNEEHAAANLSLFWQAAEPIIWGDILSYTTHRDKELRKSYNELQSSLTSAYVQFKDHPTHSNREQYITQKSAFDAVVSQMEAKYTFSARSRFHKKPNKAPGPDGLTNEFYKIVCPNLEVTLAALFNSFMDGSTLPLYLNSALLKVFPKAAITSLIPPYIIVEPRLETVY